MFKRFRVLLLVLAVAAVSFAVAACDNPIVPTQKVLVTFDTGVDGSDVASQSVSIGGTVVEPEVAPTRNGYEFVQWLDESGEAYNFSTIVLVGMTLTADWGEPIEYDIEYVLPDGATNDSGNPTKYTVEDVIALNDATLAGSPAMFLGWFRDNEGAALNSMAKGTYGKLVLHARFSAVYNLTYFYGDGFESATVVGGENPDFYLSEVGLTLLPLEFVGYSFNGWLINNQGSPVNKILLGTTGNIELYASFSLTTYTVTYHKDNGVIDGSGSFVESYTIQDGGFDIPDLKKTGYYFDGWLIDNEGDLINAIGADVYGDLQIYAKFRAIEYAITYYDDGGTVHTGVLTPSYTIEDAVELPVMKKDGYTFDGWYTNEHFNGSKQTNIAVGSTGEKVYHAKYIAIEYAITYELNDGTVVGGTNPDKYTIEQTVTLFDAKKTGHKFLGWFDNEQGTGQKIESFSGEFGAKKFYAIFEEVADTITYYLDEGEIAGEYLTTYNETDLPYTLPTPSRDGFRFDGWYAESTKDGTPVVEISVGTSGNLEFYAKWIKRVSVTFELNGGNANAAYNKQEFDAGGTILEPSAPTKNDCYFYRWENANGEKFDFSAPINDDVVIYAIWITQAQLGTQGLLYDFTTAGVAKVKGAGTATDADLANLVIPDFVLNNNDWLPVVSVVGFKNNTKIITLTFGANVTTIESESFSGAFSGCTELTTVYLSKNLTTISSGAFSGCTKLTTVVFPENFAGTEIGESMFSGCTALVSIILPSSIRKIGGSAFSECTSLERVILNEGLETINSKAFSNTTKVKHIVIPKTVVTIQGSSSNNGAFNGWTNTQYIHCSHESYSSEPTTYQAYWYGSAKKVYNSAMFDENKNSLYVSLDQDIIVATVVLLDGNTARFAAFANEPVVITGSTASSGKVLAYKLGDNYVDISAGFGENVSLTEVEVEMNVTVTFDLNGGTDPADGTYDAITAANGVILSGYNIPDPSRDGYIFLGWFVGDSDVEFDLAAPVYASITIKAKWGAEVEVTFSAADADNAELFTSVIVGEGGKVAAPSTDPAKAGYKFVGWYTVDEYGDFDDLYDFNTIVGAVGFTLKAKFAEIVAVTFYVSVEDSTVHDAPQNVAVGDKATMPESNPTHATNIFYRWENADGTPFDFDTAINVATSVYGGWITPEDLVGSAGLKYATPANNEIVVMGVGTASGDDLKNIVIPAFKEVSGVYYPVVAIKTTSTTASEKFNGNTSIQTVVIGKNVREILPQSLNGAFENCTNLKTVVLGKSVTVLGNYTFNNCKALERVVLNDGLTTIGTQAFNGTYTSDTPKIKNLVIPSSVTSIDSTAFTRWDATQYIHFEGTSKPSGFSDGSTNVVENSTLFDQDGKIRLTSASQVVVAFTMLDGSVIYDVFEKGVEIVAPSYTEEGTKFYIWTNGNDEFVLANGTTTDIRLSLLAYDKRITLTINLDGAEGENPTGFDNQEIDNGGQFTPLSVPVRNGYEFDGWINVATGAEFDFGANYKASVEIKAKWLKYITVYFEVNGVTTDPDYPSVEVLEGNTITKPTVDPELSGHEFRGWVIVNGDGSVSDYNFSTKVGNENITLRAKLLELVTVTFYNAIDDLTVHTTQSVAATVDKAERPASNPAIADMFFARWENADGTPFDFNTVISAATSVYGGWVSEADKLEADQMISLFTYSISNGEAHITGETNESDSRLVNLVIPACIVDGGNYYPVVSITGFDRNSNIQTVVIGKNVRTTVKSNSYGVFEGSSNITKVILGESMETIGSGAFYGCTKITHIVIPSSVASFAGSDVFTSWTYSQYIHFSGASAPTDFDKRNATVIYNSGLFDVNGKSRYVSLDQQIIIATVTRASGSVKFAAFANEPLVITGGTPASGKVFGYTKDGNYVDINAGFSANVSLTEVLLNAEVTVTFNLNGGTDPADGTYDAITAANGVILNSYNIPNPSKAGFVFIGWFVGDSNVEFDLATRVYVSMTLKAKWGAEVEVTFSAADADNAELFTSVIVGEGGKVVAPSTDPVKADHEFVGWYTVDEDGEFVDLYDFDTVVGAEDFTLKAKFVQMVTVTFYVSVDNATEHTTQRVGLGLKATKPQTNPTNGTEVFFRWQNADGTPFDFDAPINAATSVYGGWITAAEQAEADYWNGIFNLELSNNEFIIKGAGDKTDSRLVNLVIPAFLKHTDGNYYPVVELRGVSSSGITGNTNIKTVVIGRNVRKLTDNNNYGAFEGCTGITEITLGASVESVSSYAFSCSNLEKLVLNEGLTSVIGTYVFSSTSKLKHLVVPSTLSTFTGNSNWTSSTYIHYNGAVVGTSLGSATKITNSGLFDANGKSRYVSTSQEIIIATVTRADEDSTVTRFAAFANEPLVITGGTPASGKVFGYTKDGNYVDINAGFSANVSLVEVLLDAEVTITFNLDGGTDPEDGTYDAITDDNGFIINNIRSIPEPTRAGYNFKGWFIGDSDVEFDLATPVFASMILKAKWAKIVVVTLNLNGGITADYPTQLAGEQGAVLTMPTEPTHSDPNTAFGGWYTVDEEGAPDALFDYGTILGEDNFALIAVWGEKVTVTFDLGGQIITRDFIKDEAIQQDRIPTKAGYVAIDYLKDSVSFDLSTPITANITLVVVLVKEENLFKSSNVTLTYQSSSKEFYVTEISKSGDSLIIPDYAKHTDGKYYKVTAFGSNGLATGWAGLVHVKLSNNLTILKNNTFFNDKGLKHFRIPTSVVELEAWTLQNSINISRIHVPSSVTKISSNSFSGWEASQAISVDYASGALPSNFASGWNASAAVKYIGNADFYTGPVFAFFKLDDDNYMLRVNDAGVAITAPAATLSGKTFVGWYSDRELTQQVTEFSISADTVFYAKWN